MNNNPADYLFKYDIVDLQDALSALIIKLEDDLSSGRFQNSRATRGNNIIWDRSQRVKARIMKDFTEDHFDFIAFDHKSSLPPYDKIAAPRTDST